MTSTQLAQENRDFRAAVLRMITRRSFMTKGAVDKALENAKEQIAETMPEREQNSTDILILRAHLRDRCSQILGAFTISDDPGVRATAEEIWRRLFGEEVL